MTDEVWTRERLAEKCRSVILDMEGDAAQDRGEVATAGGDKSKIPSQNFATVADIGLTHKDVHDARLIRDAEAQCRGVTVIIKRGSDAE